MLEDVLPDWEKRIEERGEKRGEKRGKEKIAKKMLDFNETIEKIITFTGLTKQDILALKTKSVKA